MSNARPLVGFTASLVGLLFAPTAEATQITRLIDIDITFSVDSEIPVGAYPAAGSLVFEDSGLTGIGFEAIAVLDLEVTLGSFSTGPYVADSIFATFQDGVLTELDGVIQGDIDVFFGLIEPDEVRILRDGGPVQASIGTYATRAIPEPGTGLLLLLGLVGVGVRSSRRAAR